jgi:hypothetical protein
MIVIGADTHKSSHTIAAVDAATGGLVAARTVAANEPGHRAALAWGRALVRSWCGRSRTAGMCRAGWNGRWSDLASAWCVSRPS